MPLRAVLDYPSSCPLACKSRSICWTIVRSCAALRRWEKYLGQFLFAGASPKRMSATGVHGLKMGLTFHMSNLSAVTTFSLPWGSVYFNRQLIQTRTEVSPLADLFRDPPPPPGILPSGPGFPCLRCIRRSWLCFILATSSCSLHRESAVTMWTTAENLTVSSYARC